MILRVCGYGRYSSDMQSQSSIEDQFRLCRERARIEGWDIVGTYEDTAISGASMLTRNGIQDMMRDAQAGKFDAVLSEALDRLSRDQADIALIYRQLQFLGIKIITLAEGEINTMHIGLKGTMNAMFLQDLAAKTHRGQRGRVENGKSGGGISYGYNVVKRFDANGEAIRGDREINEEQAVIVRRVFNEYANDNKSPKAIAAQFNKEAIPSPSGGQWSQSTINGNRKRGTGILNNEIYIGQLVWNRQKFIKNPDTGKRVTRMNDESEWIRQELPELRIVDQELWEAVKARQTALEHKKSGLWRTNRPQYLLSGLLKCGSCGGGYSKINATHYGCAAARNKGEAACDNRRTIKRQILEGVVLGALGTHLMRDDLLEVFCQEYTRHMNTLVSAQHAHIRRYKAEQAKLAKQKANVIEAIKDGVPASMVKDELERVCNRQSELEALLVQTGEKPKVLIHPAMAKRYRSEISSLCQALKEQQAGEAREHVRALIEKITLTPKKDQDGLRIDLYGDLAGILSMAMEKKDMNEIQKLKRLRLLPSNDNSAEAFLDSVGSGGRL